MAKQLTVTLKISDGVKEESIQVLVPDNLLEPHIVHNDRRQDRASLDVGCAFTDVYTRFVKGGE
jgi:hypothetical protein